MTRPHTWRRPGWYGIRLRRYWVWRDVRRHRLVYSERNRFGCRLLLHLGPWQLWVKE